MCIFRVILDQVGSIVLNDKNGSEGAVSLTAGRSDWVEVPLIGQGKVERSQMAPCILSSGERWSGLWSP